MIVRHQQTPCKLAVTFRNSRSRLGRCVSMSRCFARCVVLRLSECRSMQGPQSKHVRPRPGLFCRLPQHDQVHHRDCIRERDVGHTDKFRHPGRGDRLDLRYMQPHLGPQLLLLSRYRPQGHRSRGGNPPLPMLVGVDFVLFSRTPAAKQAERCLRTRYKQYPDSNQNRTTDLLSSFKEPSLIGKGARVPAITGPAARGRRHPATGYFRGPTHAPSNTRAEIVSVLALSGGFGVPVFHIHPTSTRLYILRNIYIPCSSTISYSQPNSNSAEYVQFDVI